MKPTQGKYLYLAANLGLVAGVALCALLLSTMSGCVVDVNLAASNALQGIITTAYGNMVAGMINSIFPAM